jgi:hypothetical protein
MKITLHTGRPKDSDLTHKNSRTIHRLIKELIITAATFIQKLPLEIILRPKMVLIKAKLSLLMRKKKEWFNLKLPTTIHHHAIMYLPIQIIQPWL